MLKLLAYKSESNLYFSVKLEKWLLAEHFAVNDSLPVCSRETKIWSHPSSKMCMRLLVHRAVLISALQAIFKSKGNVFLLWKQLGDVEVSTGWGHILFFCFRCMIHLNSPHQEVCLIFTYVKEWRVNMSSSRFQLQLCKTQITAKLNFWQHPLLKIIFGVVVNIKGGWAFLHAPTSNLTCVELVGHFHLSWSRFCGNLKFQRSTFPAFPVLPIDFRWKGRGIWLAFLEHHFCLLLAQVSNFTLCW